MATGPRAGRLGRGDAGGRGTGGGELGRSGRRWQPRWPGVPVIPPSLSLSADDGRSTVSSAPGTPTASLTLLTATPPGPGLPAGVITHDRGHLPLRAASA